VLNADCANFKGEFKDWDNGRRDAWVAKLHLSFLPMSLPGL
jgi:hypothetical protein